MRRLSVPLRSPSLPNRLSGCPGPPDFEEDRTGGVAVGGGGGGGGQPVEPSCPRPAATARRAGGDSLLLSNDPIPYFRELTEGNNFLTYFI